MPIRNRANVDYIHGDRRMEPEQTLWVAVLSQAVRDCFSHVSRTNITWFERAQARDFLIKNGKHFRLVCELAGRDPNYVHNKIKKHILRENGWNVDQSIKDTRKVYRQSNVGRDPRELSSGSTMKRSDEIIKGINNDLRKETKNV